MRRLLLAISIVLLSLYGKTQGLVINEVSQGLSLSGSGNQEYIELVVVGPGTCSDTSADIRKWIVDDQNGWFSTSVGTGISTGHIRFADNLNWAKVPYGSIILLYNDAGANTRNPKIPADDPTDANKDNVYIVPLSSIYIDYSATQPSFAAVSATYVYPTIGYTTGGANWTNLLGLSNGTDAVVVVSPNYRAFSYHAIGYGSLDKTDSLNYFTGTGGSDRNYYLTDGQYDNPTSWAFGNLLSTPAQETPGAPNTAANATWISSLKLRTIAKFTVNDTTQCLNQNSFSFTNASTASYCDTSSFSAKWSLTTDKNLTSLTGTGSSHVNSGAMTIGSAFTTSLGYSVVDGVKLQSTVVWPTSPNSNYYVEVPLTPANGYNLDAISYAFTVRFSAAASANDNFFQFAYIIDAAPPVFFGPALQLPYNSNNSAAYSGTIPLNEVLVNSGHSLKIRVYIYAEAGTSASRNVYLKGFTLGGRTIATTTPTLSYTWDFGDGSATVSTKDAIHTYASAGAFTVKLTVNNGCGCIDDTTVKVFVVKPTASFTINNPTQCLNGNNFTFTSTSTVTPIGYITGSVWDFGDGSPTVSTNPASHSYISGGAYNVKLTVTDSTGCTDTITKTIRIPPAAAIVHDSTYVCNSYSLHGITYSSSTVVNDTTKISTSPFCDSLVNIHHIFIQTITAVTKADSTYGCNSVTYNGANYTSNTILKDTIRSAAPYSCDSLYNVHYIFIKTITPLVKKDTVYGCNSVVYNSITYTSSVALSDTVRSVVPYSCDSIYNFHYINVQNITPVTKADTIYGCNSVVYNSINYTASTVLKDTIKTVAPYKCDSVYTIHYIRVQNITPTTQHDTAFGCKTVVFNNVTYTSSTIIRDTVRTSAPFNCDSIYKVHHIIVQNINAVANTINQTKCDSVIINGIHYTSSIVLRDTLMTLLGCDSVYNITNIIINHATVKDTSACILQGGSFTINAQNFTTAGNYAIKITNSQGCDSTINLHLNVTRLQTLDTAGCDSVRYNGIVYTTNASFVQSIPSQNSSCDSIQRTVNIIVKKKTASNTNACIGPAQTYTFNGQTYSATGQYSVTLTNTQGCDSIANLYLVKSMIDSTVLSGCDSVFFNNQWYYGAATVKDTVKSIATTCDSVIHIHSIVINKSRTTNISACVTVGGNYNFFGQTLTASGSYAQTIPTSSGCDSTIRLRLVVAQIQAQDRKGCDSLVYNGKTYYASTTVSDTLHSQSGCDSIIHQNNIIITPVPQANTNACIGAGQSYSFNGQTLTVSGNYTTTYQRPGLCDSIVHLKLLVAQLQTITYQGCSHYTYNGVDYTSSTTLHDTLKNNTGCDSILRTINILITPSIQIHTTACIKQGQSYSFNGQSLTTGGSYTAQLTAQAGCDSVVNLYLVVATTQSQNLTGCDSVQLNGSIYYNSIQVTDTTRSIVSGCDSLYKVFIISIKQTPQKNVSVCLSQGQTYNFNGQTLTASGQYSTVFTRPGDCDSIVHLSLVIPVTQSQTLNGCDSVLYKGAMYYSSATAKDTVKSGGNCDSIYHLVNIVVKASPKTNTTACIKQGQSYNFNGQTLTTNGYYTTVYQMATCDSTVKLYLTVAQAQTQTVQGCDSLIFKGQAYYASATVSDTTHSIISNCDSVISVTNIVINPVKHQFITACLSSGQTYNFNGQVLTNTGNYQTTYAGSKCDSIVHLYLVATKKDSVTIQGCTSVTYNGVTYTSSTTLQNAIPSSITGCDSIQRTFHILVNGAINTNTTACIKQGQSYLFSGQNLTTGGLYTATYTAQAGCDSTVKLYLTVSSTQNQTLNGCDSLSYKGVTYFSLTQITDTIKSVLSNCDSLYNITDLIIKAAPAISLSICLGAGQTYNFNGQVLTASGNYTTTYQRPGDCDSTVKLKLVIAAVQTQNIDGCDSAIYNGLTYFASVVLRDTVHTLQSNCDSIYHVINITIKPAPKTFTTACIKQGQSYNFTGQVLTTGGSYTATYQTASCDSTVKLYLTVSQTQIQTVAGCDSVVFKGKTYYASTAVNDTTHSLVSGCDSIIVATNIVINPIKHQFITGCIARSQTYNFNGQLLTATGNYTTTYTRPNLCDSVVHLYLVATQKDTVTVQGCSSVVYNGVTYTSSTTVQNNTASWVTGCDSIQRTVDIIISTTISTNTTACIKQGQSYSFNGQTLTTTGYYTTTYTLPAGCDSTVKLYLTVSNSQNQMVNGCDSIRFKGIAYYTSTQIIDTTKSLVSGCDSLYAITNLVIKASSVSSINMCLAPGQTYSFNGQTLTTSGNYTTTYQRPGDCDSTIRLKLVIAVIQTQTINGCDSVIYNGRTYTASTVLSDTMRSIGNCDSVYHTLNINVKPSPNSFTTVCIVQGQNYNFNGQILTVGGYYTTAYQTASCDSIVKLYLTVAQQKTQQLKGCDSIQFNGIVYYTSTSVNDTLRSAVSGCDSVIRTTLISIQFAPHTNINACVAPGQTYNFNGQILSATGHYQTVYTTSRCDSTVQLYLVAAKKDTLRLQSCSSVTYNGVTYTTSTFLSDTIHSSIGCDSILRTINIVITQSINTAATACIKQGQSYLFNGQNLTATGNYTGTFAAQAGCDSVVHLYLLVSQTQTQTVRGCDSVLFNNKFYYISTQITDTLRSVVSSCDSLYVISNVIVQNSVATNTSICLGVGQNYNFNGQILATSGNYTTTYQRPGHCDSTVHLTLVVPVVQTQTFNSCDSFKYNGINYYTSTSVHDTIKSINNCDSVYHIVEINIRPSAQTFITACIQNGQVYAFNGQSLNTTGNYAATFSRPGSCDSVVHLYLVVSTAQTQTVNGCGIVIYNGVSYTVSTSVTDTVRSFVTSCDSLIRTTLIKVNPKPPIQISGNVTICKGDTAQLTASSLNSTISWTGFGGGNTIVVSPSVATTYTASATDNNGCSNTASVVVSVEEFILNITTATNPVLMGANAIVQTNANLPYSVYEWQPSAIFSNQTLRSQRFIADSSMQIFVIAKSNDGCKDTAYLSLVVTPLDDIYIPSGFTPNGDGKNDVVLVIGAFKELDFKIFNRWGQMIFYTTDKHKGWDGKLSGILQPSGTYVYVVKVKKTNGQVVEKKGTVTLIK